MINQNIQENVQKTNIRIFTCCPPKKPYHRKKSCDPKRKKRFIVEDMCGEISQKCNTTSSTYFVALGLEPSASIRIDNNSENCTMTVIITSRYSTRRVATVGPHQQLALLLRTLKALMIQCDGAEADICHGKYFLKLKYKI